MKTNLNNLQILALAITAGLMMTGSADLHANASGAALNGNGGRTGAPGDVGTCNACHSGGAFGTVEALITVEDMMGPVTEFIAGVTYTVTVELTSSSGTPAGNGFQATVLDSSNNFIGTFSNPSAGTGVASSGGRSYWEQTATSAANTFSVDWTAPAAMVTTVTIYAAGAAVNGTGGTGGDSTSLGASFSASLPVELMNFSVD